MSISTEDDPEWREVTHGGKLREFEDCT